MIDYFISFLLRMLKDQRGEAGTELEAEDEGVDADSEDEESADDDDENVTLDLGDEDEESGDEAEPTGDKPETKPDVEDLSAKLTQLDKDIAEKAEKFSGLEKAITEANATLHKLRQEKKSVKSEADEEEAVFTDEQLKQILDEHEDDKAVLFQVVKQLAKQQVKGVKQEAVNATEVAAKQKEFNTILTQRWPQLDEPGSELRGEVDKAKEILGLEDHPYGDWIGASTLILNQLDAIRENAKEEGRQEVLKGKAENARKKSVKSNALAGKGRKTDADTGTISKSQLEAEKALGFTTDAQKKLYRKLIKPGKNAAITVEV